MDASGRREEYYSLGLTGLLVVSDVVLKPTYTCTVSVGMTRHARIAEQYKPGGKRVCVGQEDVARSRPI